MKWAIFAELARVLCPDEQSRMTNALDLVGGGSVGPNPGGTWEVFFRLQAIDSTTAKHKGHAAMEHALQRAGIEVDFAIRAQAVTAAAA